MIYATIWRRLLPAVLWSLPWTALAGAPIPVPASVVEIPGELADRDEKPYRDLLAGVTRFENSPGALPGATLRFKVRPRHDGVAMDALVLQIVGDHTRIAVPLDADHTFVLPVDAGAASDNAMVRFNRPSGSLAWRAEIRSPGVPVNARRLGDLLLECRVAFVADLPAYIHHPINMLVVKLPDPCRTLPINFFSFADRPLFGATLVDGQRRSMLSAAMLHGPAFVPLPGQEDWLHLRDRAYTVKYKELYDQRWPDDTLVQFDYMDDAS